MTLTITIPVPYGRNWVPGDEINLDLVVTPNSHIAYKTAVCKAIVISGDVDYAVIELETV